MLCLLDSNGNQINTRREIKELVVVHYKTLFAPIPRVWLENQLILFPRVVSSKMNEWLCCIPQEDEIKGAVFEMKKNTSPDPDRLSVEFFQTHWSILKKDLIRFIVKLFKGECTIRYHNSTFISLSPKTQDPTKLSHYRLIDYVNVLYKIITKLIAQGLAHITP